MSIQQMTQLCDVLSLIQCIGAHSNTCLELIRAHIPFYIFPFLHNNNKCPFFEHLRLSSLGVIDVLVKVNFEYLLYLYIKIIDV